MKTIYLKSNTNDLLIADIQRVLPNYTGTIEYTEDNIHIHYIGDIMLEPQTIDDEYNVITPAVMVGAYHANLLVDENFDETIFETLVEKPNNPKYIFA